MSRLTERSRAKKRSGQSPTCAFDWRRRRDSNPRYPKRVKQFSRLPHSTTLPPLRMGETIAVSADGLPQVAYMQDERRWALLPLLQASNQNLIGRGLCLAERWGFEPQIRFRRIHDFQSCSFGQLGHLSASVKPRATATLVVIHNYASRLSCSRNVVYTSSEIASTYSKGQYN